MFCPSCKDEFRPGFTRCGRCNVDLVEDLSRVEPAVKPAAEPAPAFPVRMGDYCGFFSLDEARAARDRLRERRIRSEIVLREAPDADWNAPVNEEFWLRVEVARFAEASAVLEQGAEASAAPETDDSATFNCSECGQSVAAEETFCPKCGARFED